MQDNFLPATVPQYAIASPDVDLSSIFGDAMAGLSFGRNPMIKVKQGRFRIVDRDGNETPVKPTELVGEGELPIVILRAKRAITKVYYASAYDPGAEPTAPDCYSDDAVTPAADVKEPVCSSCAACPMNAWNSGRNNRGEPTKGKACSDLKVLAVFYRGSIYELRVNPSSLKNLGAYFAKLQEHRLSPGAVVTFMGLDADADHTILTFRVGQFVPQENLHTLAEKAAASECEMIVNPPKRAASSDAKPAPKAVEKKTQMESAPTPPPEVDLGLGAEKAAEKPKKAAKKTEPEPEADKGMSDDEVDDILNL